MSNNERAIIGGNNPPTPMEQVADEYDDVILEAHNWTDGKLVDSEEKLKALDAVLKQFKTYKSALVKAGDEYKEPLHKAWKASVEEVKVYIKDADTIQAALVATGKDFRAELAAKKEAEKRAAYEEAERLKREAESKAAQADSANLEEQREAHDALEAALQASKEAQAANKDKVTGLRKVPKHEIEDHKLALHWIAKNDKAAMTAFIEEYVRKNFKAKSIDGVRTWIEKEAF